MTSIVRRDRWGIAHVDSPNVPAAFEAQGWIAASDRIWQMDSDRLKALGRWGEEGAAAGESDGITGAPS